MSVAWLGAVILRGEEEGSILGAERDVASLWARVGSFYAAKLPTGHFIE